MIPYADEELAYYSEYGRALAAWTDVEQSMFVVSRMFFPDGMPRHILGMGFTGIQGFQSKRLFVDRCVTRAVASLPGGDALQLRWDALDDMLDTLSTKRNHLAHYLTIRFESNPTEGRRIALCSWTSKKSDPAGQPSPGSYCVRDLIRTRREFEDANNHLLNFAHRLVGLPEPLQQSGKPEDDLPTMQEISDQIHAKLGHPRVSAKERKRQADVRNAEASLESHINAKPNETSGSDS